MVFDLVGVAVCFKWYFKIVYCCQFFDCFDEFEFVVVYQEVDCVVVCVIFKAVVKLFFIVNGEGWGFFVVEWIICVEIFVLFFQFYMGIDQIDDVSVCQQIINEYVWDLFSYRF